MERADILATGKGDNLDRLLGLLRAAQAEQARRQRVDLQTACRQLLVAIDQSGPTTRASSPAAA